jgi:hypothetical protein
VLASAAETLYGEPMKRILMLASAGLLVVALVLAATTPAMAAGYRSEGAAAKPPQPPDAGTVRLVETKLGDELALMLGRRQLVGVIVFLADQPSLEITAAARSFYQLQDRHGNLSALRADTIELVAGG